MPARRRLVQHPLDAPLLPPQFVVQWHAAAPHRPQHAPHRHGDGPPPPKLVHAPRGQAWFALTRALATLARWQCARPLQSEWRGFPIRAPHSAPAPRAVEPPPQLRAWLPNAHWLLAPTFDPAPSAFPLLVRRRDRFERRREWIQHAPLTRRQKRETDPPLALNAWLQATRFPRHF